MGTASATVKSVEDGRSHTVARAVRERSQRPRQHSAASRAQTHWALRLVATFLATSRSSDASRSSRIVDVMDDLARNGRIGHLPDQVEGLVRDNRVEVRVLFGASQQSLAPRGFFVPAGRPATVEAVWLATAYGNWRQLVPPVPPPLDSEGAGRGHGSRASTSRTGCETACSCGVARTALCDGPAT